jgi:hypothetical protein
MPALMRMFFLLGLAVVDVQVAVRAMHMAIEVLPNQQRKAVDNELLLVFNLGNLKTRYRCGKTRLPLSPCSLPTRIGLPITSLPVAC